MGNLSNRALITMVREGLSDREIAAVAGLTRQAVGKRRRSLAEKGMLRKSASGSRDCRDCRQR